MHTGHGVLVVTILVLSACSDGSEAPRLKVPVLVDSSGITPAVNDLGWRVELSRAHVVLSNFEFTTEGETHASLWRGLADLIVPRAFAHPGHLAGGEVIGELPGRFVFDWVADDGQELGQAELIAGRYQGLNFSFGSESAAPFGGASFYLEGIAEKDDLSIAFSGAITLDPAVKMVGAPFELELEGGGSLEVGLQLLSVDPSEGDTAFDHLDFGALDIDGDGILEIAPTSTAHNILRRNLQAHDHYRALEL